MIKKSIYWHLYILENYIIILERIIIVYNNNRIKKIFYYIKCEYFKML